MKVAATAAGRAASQLIAHIDRWQFGFATRHTRSATVKAVWSMPATTPFAMTRDDLARNGWSEVHERREGDSYAVTAYANPSNRKPAEVARFATTQLRLALAPIPIQNIHVEVIQPPENDFYEWHVTPTQRASDDDRKTINETFSSNYVGGSEDAVTKNVETLLGGARVPRGAWELTPGNAAAAASHPHHRATTPGFRASGLLAVVALVGIAAGTWIPPVVIRTPAYALTAGIAVMLLIVAVIAYGTFRTRRQRRTGSRSTWLDLALAVAVVIVPFLAAGAVLAAFAGPIGTAAAAGVTVTVLVAGIVFGRPVALTERYMRRRPTRAIVVSVSLAVFILNIPASAFMFGAGVPALIGSVPIGTVGLTGLIALLCAVAFAASVAGIRKTVQRRSGLPYQLTMYLNIAILAVFAFTGYTIKAAQYGAAVEKASSAASNQFYGLQAVCLTDAAANERGAYWLLGSVGRASYLVPRDGEDDGGKDKLIIDAGRSLSYTGPTTGCPAVGSSADDR